MPEPLKNMYNKLFIDDLGQALKNAYTSFSPRNFEKLVFDADWESRELKDRMRHIALCMGQALPKDYNQAIAIVRQADLSPALAKYDFENMIFPDFLELFGLDDWGLSIPALEQFTQQSSSEFAVRPFILQDPAKMMRQMEKWSQHENEHVRRLASEGCRPRLPWSIALPPFKKDPASVLKVLEHLKQDESEYVRRSVANNLNDIAKDNPDAVLATLKKWKQHDTKEMKSLINHALRTLVKDANLEALALIGYSPADVVVLGLSVTPAKVKMGEGIEFSFEVQSNGAEDQALMIDYLIHFVRANGKSNPKVFKLSKKTIRPAQTLPFKKSHSFKQISTRKYYPGLHKVEIQINGRILAEQTFELI